LDAVPIDTSAAAATSLIVMVFAAPSEGLVNRVPFRAQASALDL
jgi:hypothetical protein